MFPFYKWGSERLSACFKMRYLVSSRVKNKIYLALKPFIHYPTLSTYYGSPSCNDYETSRYFSIPIWIRVITVTYSKIMKAIFQTTCLCMLFRIYFMSMQLLPIVHLIYWLDIDNLRKYILEKQSIILRWLFLFHCSIFKLYHKPLNKILSNEAAFLVQSMHILPCTCSYLACIPVVNFIYPNSFKFLEVKNEFCSFVFHIIIDAISKWLLSTRKFIHISLIIYNNMAN